MRFFLLFLIPVGVALGMAFVMHAVRKPYTCPACNVILISLDTLRADNLPCYGYSRNTAPNLCRFAQEHTYFTKTYSQSPYTFSSHFSLFTSLFPSQHHMLTEFQGMLHPAVVTIPQVLAQHGYDTIFTGPPEVDYPLGLGRGMERGFTRIVENHTRTGTGWETDKWDTSLQTLLENAKKGKPTFLFLHTYAVHAPYLTGRNGALLFSDPKYPGIPLSMDELTFFSPGLQTLVLQDLEKRQGATDDPQQKERLQMMLAALKQAQTPKQAESAFGRFPIEERWSYYVDYYQKTFDRNDPKQTEYLRALYDERIFQLDNKLERVFSFLKEKNLTKNTIVIITGDHGEEFMEHGKLFHNDNIYNTVTHVPLIIAAPSFNKNRIDDLTQGIDIYPTILGLLDMPKPKQLEGIDLTKRMGGSWFAPKNTFLISEYFGAGHTQSIRTHRYKFYLHAQNGGITVELYDLKQDPEEKNNVIGLYPRTAAFLEKNLRMALKDDWYPLVETPFPDWLDPEKKKKLLQTGYL